MTDVLLYLACMALGYFAGSKMRSSAANYGKTINVALTVCISILVFLMGARMGANEDIINNLGTIGVQSVIFTIVIWIGGILGVTGARKILGIDKYGRLKEDENLSQKQEVDDAAAQTEEPADASSLMTKVILIFVTLGLLCGYFVIRKYVADIAGFNDKVGIAMTIGLCMILGIIGFDMGLSGTVLLHMKKVGLRVFVVLAGIIAGTAAAAVVISFFLDLTVRECLAIGFGFGWYTFAPVSIAGAGHVMASAVSFLHNVLRETCGIVLIPLLAKKIGYIEVCSLPGVCAADIAMPAIVKSTREDLVVYSFTIGVVESLLIPMLVAVSIGA